MNGFDALLGSTVDYLTPKLSGLAVVTAEYPDTPRRAPLSSPVVVVGLEQIKADEASLYLGEEQSTDTYGRPLELVLRFDLCAPRRADCHSLFTTLCEALLLEDCPLSFGALWCDAIVPRPQGGGLILVAKARAEALFCRSQSASAITQFIVRSVNP